MSKKIKDLLADFVDALEEEHGEIEGFEVRLEHPIIPEEGKRQGFANIKEFVIMHLTKTQIDI